MVMPLPTCRPRKNIWLGKEPERVARSQTARKTVVLACAERTTQPIYSCAKSQIVSDIDTMTKGEELSRV